jgi:hypothetical protein
MNLNPPGAGGTEAMINEIIFYATPEGNKKVEVVFQEEDFWLSQKRMAELFGVEVNTVNYHLKEIFKSGESVEDSVIRKIRTTAADGKNYQTRYYNLDAIIAVKNPHPSCPTAHHPGGEPRK